MSWVGIGEAAEVLRALPKCFEKHPLVVRAIADYDAKQVQRTLDTVEEALRFLGPPDVGPNRDRENYAAGTDWCWLQDQFPDLRRLVGEELRRFCVNHEPPIDERVARQWLRDGVSFVVQSLAGHAPAHYEDDPEGLREIVFAGLERFAHLLSDGGQSATVSLIFDRVGLRAFELARHLYHQPTVGPRFKAMIHEQLTEPYADKLIANPPGPDEPPPWARP